MVSFNAGILSSFFQNSIKFSWSSSSEYSKFKILCKSVVSNPNSKCFAVIGYSQSVNKTFVQCDVS